MDFIHKTLDLKSRIEMIKNEMSEGYEQAVDDLEEERELLLLAAAEETGLASLQSTRSAVGRFMSLANKRQKDAYECQKERYMNCKSKKYFTQADREYIAYNQAMNEKFKAEWFTLCDYREELCEMIQVLDPIDVDMGLDEDAM